MECRQRCAVDGCHRDGAFSRLVRNCDHHRRVVAGDAVDGGGYVLVVGVAEEHLQGHAGIVDHIVTRDGHAVAGLCILTRHCRDDGRGDDDVEVVGHRVLRLGDEGNLVGHLDGHILRHVDNERVVGDVAVVEHGLAVVEIELIDAAQVLADNGQRALRRCFNHQFAVGVVHVSSVVVVLHLRREAAHVVHRRFSAGNFVLVRLILARRQGETCHGYRGKEQSFCILFHLVHNV